MDLKKAISECDTILFLCSGNVLRSAFAELYAKHINLPRKIISGGTEYQNNAISKQSKDKLLEIGVSRDLIVNFKPTHISKIKVDSKDRIIIFGMKKEHLIQIPNKFNLFPKFLLSEIDGRKDEIKDPYFEGGFDEVFDEIKFLVDKLKQNLEQIK